MKPIGRIVLVAVVLVLLVAVPSLADDGRVVIGGSVIVTPDSPVNGDLLVIGGSAEIQRGAVVHGNVAVVGGHATCAGTVDGSVFVLGGNVVLRPDAVVSGDVYALGGNVSRSPEAVVRGEVRTDWGRLFSDFRIGGFSVSPEVWRWRGSWGWDIGAFAGRLLTVLLAVLAVVLAPKYVQRVRQSLFESPWAGMGVGFLALIVVAVLGGVLIITLCLAIFGGLLWLAAWVVGLLGFSALGLELGDRLLRAFGARGFAPAWAVLLGCFVLVLLTYLPCCIGWLIWVAVASLSLGGALLALLGGPTQATAAS